ncbi:MAG: hypothetical protein P4L83_02010 [Nevskia sp.]|nr:hypothetical protein [Nevskia sp.]
MALAAVLAACTAARPRTGEVAACADQGSPACAAARDGFQRVHYTNIQPGRLVVASSRALGDLNFEVGERDDAGGRVEADYVAAAPVHEKQLDEKFKEAMHPYAGARVAAAVTVTPGEAGAEVRLRLTAVPADGAAPRPIDSVTPYQLFFSQLGFELGLNAATVPEPKEERHRVNVPVMQMP